MTVYHVGDLASDREHDAELSRVADELFAKAERGEIYLAQRRLRENTYAYIFWVAT